MKVKVIEVEATKLDKDAEHIIVFNQVTMDMEKISAVCQQLLDMGIKFVATFAEHPETALKVYSIPKPHTSISLQVELPGHIAGGSVNTTTQEVEE